MEFPNPPTPGLVVAGPGSPELSGYLRLSLLSLQRKTLLRLPGSRGGALGPFGLPQTIITHQHFTHLWVSGVGDLEGVTQSWGPWYFCFGYSGWGA